MGAEHCWAGDGTRLDLYLSVRGCEVSLACRWGSDAVFQSELDPSGSESREGERQREREGQGGKGEGGRLWQMPPKQTPQAHTPLSFCGMG